MLIHTYHRRGIILYFTESEKINATNVENAENENGNVLSALTVWRRTQTESEASTNNPVPRLLRIGHGK